MTDEELASRLAGLFAPAESQAPIAPSVVARLKRWLSRKPIAKSAEAEKTRCTNAGRAD